MTSNHLIARQHQRHKLANTFVINQKGVCRVFDLSPGGISFGCTRERKIPETLTVDIVDDSGLHLIDLSVKTVWAAKNTDLTTASIYEIVVGAEFPNDLSAEQRAALERYLTTLPHNDRSLPE